MFSRGDTTEKFCPHDLIWIVGGALHGDGAAVPGWVTAVFAETPVVVVRRGRAPEGFVAVGVRGATRAERFAGFVPLASLRRRVAPADLVGIAPKANRLAEVAALRGFVALTQAWAGSGLRWGPAGSVGFELATGRPTVRAESDLDVTISAPEPLRPDSARRILDAAARVGVGADVVVETPHGGFALREFCASGGGRCLLKTHDGPRLVSDPWRAPQGDSA